MSHMSPFSFTAPSSSAPLPVVELGLLLFPPRLGLLLGSNTFGDKMVYGKACHLPLELEHKAFWAVRELNADPKLAGEKHIMNLTSLDEWRSEAYESAKMFKEKWEGLYHIDEVYGSSAIKINNFEGTKPQVVNGIRLKHYMAGDPINVAVDVIQIATHEEHIAILCQTPVEAEQE
ncbi:hypothetical protein ZWY2020_019664 [Hordeum vulgare]|nr:hypothetical protein ZWY2020_019664 [Hordeum vulgare]